MEVVLTAVRPTCLGVDRWTRAQPYARPREASSNPDVVPVRADVSTDDRVTGVIVVGCEQDVGDVVLNLNLPELSRQFGPISRASRRGIRQRKIRCALTRRSSSGAQSAMSQAYETTREPGCSSERSFGRSFRFGFGCRKRVTTVADRTSAKYMSPSLNSTLSATPASRAFASACLTRVESISMPTPRAPNSFAAVIGMRPSPDPRS
jgi:hypothetical protein